MRELPEALRAMGNYRQFCIWRPVLKENGDIDKVPVSPTTGYPTDPHDPSNQLTAAEALAAAEASGLYPGFVFGDTDPFFFIDIDHALQPDGSWSSAAMQLCQQFQGAAIEVSFSGTGLHIFGCSTSQLPHSNKNAEFGLEMYRTKRFVALTFNQITGQIWTDLTAQQEACATLFFPPREEAEAVEWEGGPDPEWMGPSDDDELVRRMLASRGSDASFLRQRASFTQLWEGDEAALAEFYPSSTGDLYDRSSADAALCSHLAFWTGKDCERMERLFSRSALGQREKWVERQAYRRDTINFAVGLCTDVYKDPRIAPLEVLQLPPSDTSLAVPISATYQLLAPDQQQEFFKGCIYVRSQHKVFMPDGTLLNPPRFNATRGGYEFAVDGTCRSTTKKAFEALTESQHTRWPQADGTCFRPEEPPGAIIQHEGLSYVNTYVPAVVESYEGDVSPFLGLLAKILPVATDRAILLAYMAACVQYPGTKFQWAPVLQGVQGNGKTLVISAISKAVGERYTHLPDSDQLADKFNAWVEGALFAGVEEICVPGKPQIVEHLKRLITNSRVKVEGKGIDQRTGDNRANFLFCSNYQDGVTKIRSDRRYCVFFTAQQSLEDLERDGMLGAYFPNLYTWFNQKGGAANITHYLQHYAIPDELNPAYLCQRAPNTSSTAAAIVASRSIFEQEVAEAIEEGRYGFRGGWLSSCQIADLVDDKLRHIKLPRNRRKYLLENLGFVQHPGLPNGRCFSPLQKEDGRKPTLYIHQASEAIRFEGQAVINAYVTAQEAGHGT